MSDQISELQRLISEKFSQLNEAEVLTKFPAHILVQDGQVFATGQAELSGNRIGFEFWPDSKDVLETPPSNTANPIMSIEAWGEIPVQNVKRCTPLSFHFSMEIQT